MEIPTKEEVTFVTAIFPTEITYDVNQIALIKKSSHSDVGRNADFAIQSLKLVNLFLRKRHPFTNLGFLI